ncbi:MAG: type II toxin-antitoxin system HicA family toxin [Ignavibacteriae bacterium]|nr:type II toxin-antitoxin system HicA family toxin [Ignavibacteriota bacterium]MCB9216689.1 type II toxin-antitoxin system HicA family toxin [Ignavibacteria bacterium]
MHYLPRLHETEKPLDRILSGSKNIRFGDFLNLLQAFGFRLSRVAGSHHIFVHSEIPEHINIQNVHGEVKMYQARQFLALIKQYNLSMEDSDG